MSFLGKIKIVMLKGEKGDKGDSGSAGDYSTLTNKPSINNVALDGQMTSDDLGLASVSRVEALEDEVESLVVGEWTDLAITDPQSNTVSGSFLKYRLDADGMATIAGNIDFSGGGSTTLATLPAEITPVNKASGGLAVTRKFEVPLFSGSSGTTQLFISGSTLSIMGYASAYTIFEVSYYPKFV